MKCPACGKQHTGGGKFCRHCGTLLSSTSPGPSPRAGGGAGLGNARFGARPHRGTLILVLGILGLVMCALIGAAAWIMGRSDLALMRTGAMDASGETATRAGMICGIISVVLTVVTALLYLALFGWFMAGA